jgi:putative flippase GtrA
MKQFLLFAGIGAIGTAGHYTTLIVLVEALRVDPLLASTLGFVVGALINYFLNYYYTFASAKSHRDAMSKFALVALVGAIANSAMMHVALTWLGLYYLLAQIIATAVVLVWNFIVNKLWTFATPRPPHE